ncbi:TerC/Alx family metal homeostasis membrane protein [Candidatus Hamiltonella endosymbiont of Tuberolachnus salignus]|uniref:TerC/Alx family metal homeostasis membrane protein n=1 Tax=Candidatus Williamhamiltonella endosymbiont of Tuberolachnus salignus TaxID=3077954 RepID=UPI0030CEC288
MEPLTIGFPPKTLIVFVTLSVLAIFIDLFMHRNNKPISLKSACFWSLFWVGIAFVFAGFLYLSHGQELATLFITGYTLEKVLSIDNLFVIMAIFAWFAVPDNDKLRVLYWGVIGAIIFRAIFVAIGTSLLSLGPWIEFVFAGIVGWTALMMLKDKKNQQQTEDYSQHFAYRLVKRFFPIWPRLKGSAFLLTGNEVKKELKKPENSDIKIDQFRNSAFYATPLMLCLAVIELSDVIFAFDSVPAVVAVSRDPVIIYSAMVFAILGLRTLYFVLEAMKQCLIHLEKSVIALLFFIAIKLALNASEHIFHHGYHISGPTSLLIVMVVLMLGIIASFLFPKNSE